MIYRMISYLIVLFFVFVSQVSFINALPVPWNSISLILPSLFAITILGGYYQALYWWFGLILFFYAYLPFLGGAYVLVWLLSIWVIHFFSYRLFINKSFWGVMGLFILGSLFFELCMRLVYFVCYGVGIFDLDLMPTLKASLVQIFSTVFLGAIIFLCWKQIVKKLGSYFYTYHLDEM